MEFCVGSPCEALDEEGYWSRGVVVGLQQLSGGKVVYTVNYDGWGQRWNSEVQESDIRNVTKVSLKRRKTGKRGKPNKVSNLRLCAGDGVPIYLAGKETNVTVRQVDAMNNVVVVELEGSLASVRSEAFIPPPKDKETVPPSRRHHAKKLKKTDAERRSQLISAQQVNFGCTEGARPHVLNQDIVSVSINEPLPLLTSNGQRGFLSVGDVCFFQGALVVCIQEINWTVAETYAKCFVCKEKKGVYVCDENCSLQCPVTTLIRSKVRLGSNAKRRSEKCKFIAIEATRLASYNDCPTLYSTNIRKFRTGQHLLNKIQETLSSKCLVKKFNILFDERDYELFDLNISNNFRKTFSLESGFEELDKSLGACWDVVESQDKFMFVRAIDLVLKVPILECTIQRSISTRPFDVSSYRSIARNSLYTVPVVHVMD